MKNNSIISFVHDNKIRTIDPVKDGFSPTTTVLQYLRSFPRTRGTKEGCAEGDCGACTVVLGEADEPDGIRYTAIDSCLVFLPMLHGKQLITVEDVSGHEDNDDTLHPVQQAMVEKNGSQCGYCTPGFIMSLFALYKKEQSPSSDSIRDALTGNLCRCTGYRPIVETAAEACVHQGNDQFSPDEKQILKLLLEIRTNFPSLHIENENCFYSQPGSLQDALALRLSNQKALLISGATDIALRVTKKHESIDQVIDLSAVPELKLFEKNEKEISIGAGVSLEDIKNRIEKELPALHKMLSVFGSRQIRSLATLGGNIGSASPIGDTLPVLIAYDAIVQLTSANASRKIPVRDFITGYRQTRIKPDEIITDVIIPVPDEKTIIRSYKISKRKDLDISTVSSSFMLKLNDGQVKDIVLAYGGMAASVTRAIKTEDFLKGKKWTREKIEEAAEIIYTEFNPISDARSGAEFRRLAARNLLIKFWSESLDK